MNTDNHMQGRVCLITGATGGIGKATALGLAKQGATVIGVGRNAEKCAAATAEIREQSGSQTVTFLVADLSSQAGIRKLSDQIYLDYSRLHVLVNNAGGVYMERQVTVDGIEYTWALNHLAYFLLTNLLLDLLKASAPARIISVSSEAQRNGKINFDDLQGEKRYGGLRAYSQSKLANVMFTYELARRLEGTGVTANVVHPGPVRSGWGTNNRGWWGMFLRLIGPLMQSPEKGAATSIYLASSKEVEGVTGQYFAKSKPIRSSALSYDTALARRLWQVSEEAVHLSQ